MFSPTGLAQNAEASKCSIKELEAQYSGQLILEPKMDGFRLLAHIAEDGVHTYTRTGKGQDGKIPAIETELAKLPVGTWLDGEIVAYDESGMPEWGAVQSVMGANVAKAASRSHCLTYVVFDVLAFDGNDVRSLPLKTRRAALETIFENVEMVDTEVALTEQYEATDDNHEALVAMGWEGSIVKRTGMPYASGARGRGWYKYKANDEMDVVIMGFKPGENSFTGLIGAIEFGQVVVDNTLNPIGVRQPDVILEKLSNGGYKVIRYRGRCSGMDMATRRDITNRQQELIDNKAVISMAYMGLMPSGSPRHPQYRRFRNDKPASECVWT